MDHEILSITQLNEYVRSLIDGDPVLGSVAVRGEISNYKLYPSGHHYFTLKDDASSLKCVMFKGSAFRLRFRPENGMKIIAFGRISVYPRDGAYQLYCTAMTVDGVGDLYAAFEQLKAKLNSRGMFDPACKKPIPKYPETIGIVTSSAGAAVHDILRILRKRYPISRVRLFPVRVQGTEAPEEICAAIAFANRHRLADVLIVGRGGGSIEDLWAFNDERVALAIHDSDIPVISAVGHEPDVTISDYVADLRAATPSNGAELCVPDQYAIRQTLDQYACSIRASLSGCLSSARQRLDAARLSAALHSPERVLSQRRESLVDLAQDLHRAAANTIADKRQTYSRFVTKLDALSPLKVMSRGYSYITTETDEVVASVKALHAGDNIRVYLSDGQFNANVTEVREQDYE